MTSADHRSLRVMRLKPSTSAAVLPIRLLVVRLGERQSRCNSALQERQTAGESQADKKRQYSDLIDREWGRSVPGTRRDKPVKIPAGQHIAFIFANKPGEGDGRIAKPHQKLVPE